MSRTDPDLTRLIEASAAGEPGARNRLLSAVYDDLLTIARSRLGVGRAGDTMQPTALVNETIIELIRRFEQPGGMAVSSRRAFFGAVALAMRTILRDARRRQHAQKRGGRSSPAALHEDPEQRSRPPFDDVDLLALDSAVEALQGYDERWYNVVMYRFYAARSIDETAELLGVGETTVKTDWKCARAWLLREMHGSETPQ